MAYATSNPPKLVVQSVGGSGVSIWTYASTDAAATVDAANYITNGGSLGLKIGDIMFATDTVFYLIVLSGGTGLTTVGGGDAHLGFGELDVCREVV